MKNSPGSRKPVDKSPGRIAAGSPRSGFRRLRHLINLRVLRSCQGRSSPSWERLLGSLFLVRNDGARPFGEEFLLFGRKPDVSADPALPLGSEVSGDDHLLTTNHQRDAVGEPNCPSAICDGYLRFYLSPLGVNPRSYSTSESCCAGAMAGVEGKRINTPLPVE